MLVHRTGEHTVASRLSTTSARQAGRCHQSPCHSEQQAPDPWEHLLFVSFCPSNFLLYPPGPPAFSGGAWSPRPCVPREMTDSPCRSATQVPLCASSRRWLSWLWLFPLLPVNIPPPVPIPQTTLQPCLWPSRPPPMLAWPPTGLALQWTESGCPCLLWPLPPACEHTGGPAEGCVAGES